MISHEKTVIALASALCLMPLQAEAGSILVPWKNVQVELDDGCMVSVSTGKGLSRLQSVLLQCGSSNEQVPVLDLKDISYVDLTGIRIFVTPSVDDDTMAARNSTSIEIPFAVRCGEMDVTASVEFVFSKGRYLLRQLRKEIAPGEKVGVGETSDMCETSVH